LVTFSPPETVTRSGERNFPVSPAAAGGETPSPALSAAKKSPVLADGAF